MGHADGTSVNGSAVILAAQDGPWAQIRTGTVVEASGSTVVVLVGASTFTASVIVPVGIDDPSASIPPAGSLVAVGRQDSSWTVFGTVLGASGNLILNGSFEDSGPGAPPVSWTLYDVSGSSSATVESVNFAVTGDTVATVQAVTAPATSLLYSSPVDVVAGERYQLSAFAGAEYEEGTAQDADASLIASWFDSDTDLYPTVTDPDILVATAVDVLPVPPWTPLAGTVVAPVSGVLRLSLRSVLAAGQTMFWDFATVRRFG